MPTLYLRVAVTFAFTLIFSLAAALWISGYIARRTNRDFFEGSMNLELEQAERIYVTEGPEHLAQYLAETDQALQGKRYLTDSVGHDLVSGQDLSAALSTDFSALGQPVSAAR